MAQSIIIYRNPLEAYFWESGMMFPVVAGTILGVIAGVVAAQVWEAVITHPRWRKQSSAAAFLAGTLTMIGTMVWLTP